ncbi:bifunctional DNA primase/polymerase [Streptomyces sp. MB09-02B]|uniref:bifunctional DNA primase/polymerase n=1 Tax=Streptomyces sp. MB09-02B TaxID=3028667 RepID=UPI0029BE37BB|nr:bifunctional DNA primase/polymerase [Streptomyces sp. MB09-02B]MDX3642214.1 bifunctional DNA primase/polymerase [Streptomyces sp. MB09-02B]
MSGGVGTGRYPEDGVDVAGVTAEGAAWLASAGTYPRSTLTLWEERPTAPVVLPCGSVFDVVSVPALFGRRMLDRLWAEGPGSGPVAVYRGRVLLFAAPGTAQRLPTLLEWEEWGSPGRTGAIPPLLCHGAGDAVTVPAVLTPEDSRGTDGSGARDTPGVTRLGSRWLVAPDTRRPWLPGPEVLLWAAVRAARSSTSATVRVSIFPPADQGAKVYDVSRRR